MRIEAIKLPPAPQNAAEMIALLDMAIEAAKDLNRQLDDMHEFLRAPKRLAA